jgi:hypothetical protein
MLQSNNQVNGAVKKGRVGNKDWSWYAAWYYQWQETAQRRYEVFLMVYTSRAFLLGSIKLILKSSSGFTYQRWHFQLSLFQMYQWQSQWK